MTRIKYLTTEPKGKHYISVKDHNNSIKKAKEDVKTNLIKNIGKTTFIEHLTELQQKELIDFIKNT